MNHLNDCLLTSVPSRGIENHGFYLDSASNIEMMKNANLYDYVPPMYFEERKLPLKDREIGDLLLKKEKEDFGMEDGKLKYLQNTVRKVPNKSEMRGTALCSLARVFDEVEKTNTEGEPFYVKDLVMIDAKLRDWQRIMPRVRPSFQISRSPDPQILKKLVQGGAVFSCVDEDEFELLDTLGEDISAKLNTLPSSCDSTCMVYVNSIEDLKLIKERKPSARLIVRLPRDIPIKGSPRDELVPLFNFASSYKLNIVGISVSASTNLCQEAINNIFSKVQEVIFSASEAGFKITIIDVESELEEMNFDKNAKLLSKLIASYFPENHEIEVHLAASNHLSECSHFLFTRVTARIPKVDANGRTTYEVHVDWPKCSQSLQNTHPGACYPVTSEHPTFQTHFISDKCKTRLFETSFPHVQIGEWIYWNNVTDLRDSDTKSYHAFRFEGPEKKYELNYKPIPGDEIGLRALDTEQWQEILNHGHLLILSEKKNEHFDSYLLSESSLFVYPYKVIVKTCGISSPLLCTKALKEVAKKLGTEIENISFSRRSFICPTGQCYPHRSIEEEEKFLKKHFPGGQALQLGDPKSDHWYLYSAQLTDTPLDSTPSLEITMTGVMKEEALKNFWRDETSSETQSVADKSGFSALTPGAEIDEYSFTPCGFSYNGLLDKGFVTVHITPELPLCYISFETNIADLAYEKILDKLIATYQPAHFTVLILNNGGHTTPISGYKTTHRNETVLNGVPVHFERRRQKAQMCC